MIWFDFDEILSTWLLEALWDFEMLMHLKTDTE